MAVFALSVFGAGCWKQQTPATKPAATPTSAVKPSTPSTNPPVIAFGTDQNANTTINQELTNILRAFREVKSFRTKFEIPSQNGTVTTQMNFLRPSRFQGTMRMLNQPAIEVIVVDDSVYMRTAGGNWYDLSGTSTANSVTASLRNALNGQSSLDKIGVDPGTIVKKTEDTARSCTNYRALVSSQDGSPASLDICATNGLPKFVSLTTSTGTINFEYYDFDALFLIEKPM